MKFRISKLADKDLDRIWRWIARDSVSAANRVDNALHAAMTQLAFMPGMGHTRPEVQDSRYRFWKVYSYLIAYRLEGRTLFIVRVIHGARDLRELFRHRR